jgi:hypothetical protein
LKIKLANYKGFCKKNYKLDEARRLLETEITVNSN